MYISKRRIAARKNYLVATSAERKQAASGIAVRPRVFSNIKRFLSSLLKEITRSIKLFTRASRVAPLRQRTLFADTSACGKRVNLRLYIIVWSP